MRTPINEQSLTLSFDPVGLYDARAAPTSSTTVPLSSTSSTAPPTTSTTATATSTTTTTEVVHVKLVDSGSGLGVGDFLGPMATIVAVGLAGLIASSRIRKEWENSRQLERERRLEDAAAWRRERGMSLAAPVLRKLQDLARLMNDLEVALNDVDRARHGARPESARTQLTDVARQVRLSAIEVRDEAAELRVLGFDDIAETVRLAGVRLQVAASMAQFTSSDPEEHADTVSRVRQSSKELNETFETLVSQSARAFGGRSADDDPLSH